MPEDKLNPSAFPQLQEAWRWERNEKSGALEMVSGNHMQAGTGMALRDYFAAKAMQVLIQNMAIIQPDNTDTEYESARYSGWGTQIPGTEYGKDSKPLSYAKNVALDAFLIADVMLETRNEKEG